MTDWSVLIEAEAPPVASEVDDADPRLARLRQEMARHHGTTVWNRRSWSVRLPVDATTAARAVMAAQMMVETGAHYVGLPTWPVVRAEAVDLEVLARDLDRPAARAPMRARNPLTVGQPVGKHVRQGPERVPRRVRTESAQGQPRG